MQNCYGNAGRLVLALPGKPSLAVATAFIAHDDMRTHNWKYQGVGACKFQTRFAGGTKMDVPLKDTITQMWHIYTLGTRRHDPKK
jgi:hypothetical protein